MILPDYAATAAIIAIFACFAIAMLMPLILPPLIAAAAADTFFITLPPLFSPCC